MAEFSRDKIFKDFRELTRGVKRDNRAGTDFHKMQVELCWRVHGYDMLPIKTNATHCTNFIHRIGLQLGTRLRYNP